MSPSTTPDPPGAPPARPGVIALWRLCFGDTEEFISLYFNGKYSERNTIARRDPSGAVIAALQMIPYRLLFA
ncbi:MAG: hypothetical protein LBI96_03025, partial [Odoribacteraceae bacterium]|nr:hypothetical protein [Odoribacteraceae bacterium]